jgi:ribonuclease HI
MRANAVCDGRGNAPGTCACAVVLEINGDEVEVTRRLDDQTNNEAEYEGVILALQTALLNEVTDLTIYCDSQLVVNQVRGIYDVKQEHFIPLRHKVWSIAGQFDNVDIKWVPRIQTKRPDKLCRDAYKPPAARARPVPLPVMENPFRRS